MAHFHNVTIADINQETADTISISFNIPETLKNNFKFIQGQYITFKLNINSEEIRRSYSICSGVNDGELRVAVKRVEGGKASNYMANHFKVGQEVSIMEPMGNFYIATQADAIRNYHLFAGGSGITPMLSIIKTIIQAEPKSKLNLYYGNKNESSIIFNNKLNDLAHQYPQLKIVHVLENATDTNPNIIKGLMNMETNKKIIDTYITLADNNEYFICGPTPMMDAAKQCLLDKKIDTKKIHIEYFSSPVTEVPAETPKGATPCEATIILDGDEFIIPISPNQNILEAVLNAGYDAPYACQGGSCCTCRAKLTNGTADMVVNYALLEEEVQQGFILTCQAIPTSSQITVNYDKGK